MDQDYIIVATEPGNIITYLLKEQASVAAYNSVAASLPEEAAPGSKCYNATLSYMAMKDMDGAWKRIGG